jgi:type IV secretory pathway VirB4 component
MASQPKSTQNTKGTQDSLLIAEIKDGVVVMRDGSLRAVILGSAINFDLMSPQEQDAVEYGYQSFLNSLHFPIQIVIRSRKIDLDAYMEKLRVRRGEQTNDLLGLLMDDYIANIDALVEEVNIMDKQFYVVVPYFPPGLVERDKNLLGGLRSAMKQPDVVTLAEDDFKKYKQELAQRVSLVSSGMGQIGIRAIALGTQELIDLYYSWYNPETAAQEKLIDVNQLQAPIVTKGQGSAPRGPLPGGPF